jgi:hypothetical protein
MEEMGNDSGRGRGKSVSVPVICRIYIKRAALGEDVVAVGADGKKKAVAVNVHEEYFDLLKAILRPSCLRQQGHATAVLLGGYQMTDHAEAPPDDALPLVVHGHYQGHAALPLAVRGQQNYDVHQADAPRPGRRTERTRPE